MEMVHLNISRIILFNYHFQLCFLFGRGYASKSVRSFHINILYIELMIKIRFKKKEKKKLMIKIVMSTYLNFL